MPCCCCRPVVPWWWWCRLLAALSHLPLEQLSLTSCNVLARHQGQSEQAHPHNNLDPNVAQGRLIHLLGPPTTPRQHQRQHHQLCSDAHRGIKHRAQQQPQHQSAPGSGVQDGGFGGGDDGAAGKGKGRRKARVTARRTAKAAPSTAYAAADAASGSGVASTPAAPVAWASSGSAPGPESAPPPASVSSSSQAEVPVLPAGLRHLALASRSYAPSIRTAREHLDAMSRCGEVLDLARLPR